MTALRHSKMVSTSLRFSILWARLIRYSIDLFDLSISWQSLLLSWYSIIDAMGFFRHFWLTSVFCNFGKCLSTTFSWDCFNYSELYWLLDKYDYYIFNHILLWISWSLFCLDLTSGTFLRFNIFFSSIWIFKTSNKLNPWITLFMCHSKFFAIC